MRTEGARIILFVVLLGLALRSWAQEREATPAVVNPVLRSSLRQTLSLDGGWDFVTDPSGAGDQEKWFNPGTVWSNQLTLHVPGCWEAQGIGGPGNSTPATPERSVRPLRGSYGGTAWYRKQLTLPENWAGRQVWLKVGGVHAQGWFWVNGTYIGHNACHCGTYKYNVTDLVAPGRPVVVVAKVRNDVPSRKGLMGWIERFGGLYRSVELDATPSWLIDDVYVVGDFDRQTATVKVTLRNTGAAPPAWQLARVQSMLATLDGVSAGTAGCTLSLTNPGTTDVSLTIPLEPFRSWSPESPNLYRADVLLVVGDTAIDGWVERFGVRKWEVRGGSFYLNNQRHFIRGYGDDYIYPLTIASPASREAHRQHLQLARDYGFTYVRHHTHCEVPEFYEAADELGIMVQPELPYYGSKPSAGDAAFFDPKADLEELYTHCRRYVSLSTYCTGNEGHLGSPLDSEVYQLARRLDPTRLALHQDGGQNRNDNSDFHQGPTTPWEPGTQDASWPFTAHEYLNLATREDPRLAVKYTGAVLPPVTPQDFRAGLARAGLSWDWGVATLEAGNQLQRIYQKLGLEQARLDPACGGYIYWTMVDVGSPSAQGLLNQFWEPKASNAEYFRQFNGPTTVLARFSPKERILSSRDTLKVEWWVSHFGHLPIRGEPLEWRFEEAGEVRADGGLSVVDIDSGEVKTLGTSEVRSPQSTRPAKLRLVAQLRGVTTNAWDVWVFPQTKPPAADEERLLHAPATSSHAASPGKATSSVRLTAPKAESQDRRTLEKPPEEQAPSQAALGASPQVFGLLKGRYTELTEVTNAALYCPDLLVCERFDTNALNALRAAKTVLLLRLPGPSPGVQLGWWAIGKQAGTAVARHPAFGDFPHEGYMDELFFRLINHTVEATNEAFHNVEPLMVGGGNAGYLLHVFAARVGDGKLLASGLDLFSQNPEAVYLLDQFIRYARSRQFQPQGTLDPADPRLGWGKPEAWK